MNKPLRNLRSFSISRPHDFHLHLRSGNMMRSVVMFSASVFKYAVVMPNLVPPIETCYQAKLYKNNIKTAITKEIAKAEIAKAENSTQPSKSILPLIGKQAALNHLRLAKGFMPLMALFLTKRTTKAEVKLAKHSKEIIGYKLYPHGVTTNAGNEPFLFTSLYKVFGYLQEYGVPLLVHGEVLHSMQTGQRGKKSLSLVDVFKREEVFINQYLVPIIKHFPHLKITLEHVSTKAAVQFVKENPAMGATITVHHLLATRNHMLGFGIRPHFYCKPILKKESDRDVLLEVALSGHKQFFLGTDSAPHAQNFKENCCGAAGVFSSPFAMPLLAQIFAEGGSSVAALQAFTSENGVAHYGLPADENGETITLRKNKTGISLEEMLEHDENAMHLYKEKVVPFGSNKLLYSVE